MVVTQNIENFNENHQYGLRNETIKSHPPNSDKPNTLTSSHSGSLIDDVSFYLLKHVSVLRTRKMDHGTDG
jgi:hypothetical protein